MADPIIQKTGSISGASVAGQGSNDLVAGETVNLANLEPTHSGEAHFWEFVDTPVGTSPTMVGHTTETPSFVVDADPALAGIYEVKCTVNGVEFSTEIFAKPLTNTGGRIPALREEEQYDGGGNVRGWHEAETNFKRSVDSLLGETRASVTERVGRLTVAEGNSTQEIEMSGAIYPGSAIAIAGYLAEAVTAGSVALNLKVNGVTKFTATLNTISPSFAAQVEDPGDYPILLADRVSVEVVATSYTNGASSPSDLILVAALSSDLSNAPLTIPDASNTTKGVSKLSVAPASPTQPVAVGTNDDRVPSQNENDALQGTSGVASNANRYVTDSDSRMSDSRSPTGHAFAGAQHTVSLLAEVNSKISDATLIDTADSRLSDDRNDANAIHDNVAGEISALSEKVIPVDGDWLIIEDSADSDNKKKVQAGNLPGTGGGAALVPSQSARLQSGSSQYAAITDAAESGVLDGMLDLTVEAWVHRSTDGGWHVVAGKMGTSTPNFSWRLRITTGDAVELVISTTGSNSSTITRTPTPDMAAGSWRHIAATRDGTSGDLIIYVDGVAVGAPLTGLTGNLHSNNQDFRIGNNASGVNHYFNGYISEVRVWNVVRTPTEIADNMRKTVPPSTAGLVGYFPLDGDWDDATSNGNDLTPVNSPTFEGIVPFGVPAHALAHPGATVELEGDGGSTGQLLTRTATGAEFQAAPSSYYERNAEVTVAQGTAGEVETPLARAIYAGSAIAIHAQIDDVVTSGTITVRLKIGGSTVLTAQLNSLGDSVYNTTTASEGTHAISASNTVIVSVETSSLVTTGGSSVAVSIYAGLLKSAT